LPRRPRVFLEGGMYHVYNRLARGGRLFESDDEVEEFVGLLREVKQRDDLLIYAWCVLPTHFHLLLRTTSRPLWRSLATAQVRYSKGVNRRHGVAGPVWQSRYKAKLVEDQRYFEHLVVYIHLNPVAAGLVTDPAAWRWGGHWEIVQRIREPLADVDEVLSGFGDERRVARRRYVSALRGGAGAPWLGEGPGRLPWWHFGRAPADEELEVRDEVPFVEAGRSSVGERREADAATVVTAACAIAGLDRGRLSGRLKDRETVRARRALALVACDSYGVRVKTLADELGRSPDGVSEWLRSGAVRRATDPELDALVRALEESLRVSAEETEKD
jgi:putative transposase